jgi:hypothetical protein
MFFCRSSNIDASFIDLLYSRKVPSLSEAHKIQELISEDDANLVRLDDEIIRVSAILEQLVLERDKAHSRRSKHEVMTSTLRKIPPEILGHIFGYTLPNEIYIRPNSQRSPLILTRICRAWRVVVLSTPQLWSSLFLHEDQKWRIYCRFENGFSDLVPCH